MVSNFGKPAGFGSAHNSRTVAVLTFGLMANLVPMATFAAVMPEITADWGLTASEAGWIGGIYFGGYAASVPILASATDRIDGRWTFVGCSLLAAVASFAFAGIADGFWMALGLRFLSGVAFAGVHMPGLKLLADRVTGRARARGSAIYTSSYAIGTAGSFLLSGVVNASLGWRASFVASGIAPLLAVAAIALLPTTSERLPAAATTLDFRPVLRDRALMAYVLAFAGNIWEVSAVRAWFVAYLAWTLSLPGNHLRLPEPAIISGLASLAGFPAAIAVAELALRYGRVAITATCLTSVLVCLALAATAGGPTLVVLPLLVLVQVTSIADAGALASGAVATADPARRGTALAAYAFIGYTAAFAGPVAVGVALDQFGGAGSAMGWTAAFATMGLGSVVAAWAVRGAPR
jgi:MFS family permease